jgi:hypothetical protein
MRVLLFVFFYFSTLCLVASTSWASGEGDPTAARSSRNETSSGKQPASIGDNLAKDEVCTPTKEQSCAPSPTEKTKAPGAKKIKKRPSVTQ